MQSVFRLHIQLNLNVKAIVAATESGSTARTISKYRPHSDIIAVTPSEETARQCSIVWGVQPVVKKDVRVQMHC